MWPGSSEARSVQLPVNSVSQRELDCGVMELKSVWSPAFVCGNFLNLDNVDGVGTSSVTGTHVTVASSNSFASCQVSVLSVHVVGSTARVVSQPYSKVLDLHRSLLINPVNTDNLSSGFLELSKLTQEVPETRLGDSPIRSKDSHGIQGW